MRTDGANVVTNTNLHLVSNSRADATTNMATTVAAQMHKVVVLTIDGLKLILPQGDIRTVESVTDVDTADSPASGAGWIKYLGRRWPVYCLSDELDFLSHAPNTRRACVMLALQSGHSGYLGLLCDDARVLANFVQQSFPVPASMQLKESPISALVNYEDGLACISNASHIEAFVALAASSQERREH